MKCIFCGHETETVDAPSQDGTKQYKVWCFRCLMNGPWATTILYAEKAYKKVADIIERQRMGECLHKNWIEVTPYSGSCFIHWELMPENEKKAINSIKIRICLDCKKTLEVIGYPHG